MSVPARNMLTEDSHQKWAEALVEQRLSDVLETKRQSVSYSSLVLTAVANHFTGKLYRYDLVS